MKKIAFILTLCVTLLVSFPAQASVKYPSFSISAVERDKSVTIKGVNFPANDTFTVTMGVYGSYGVSGIVVGSTDSKSGGSLSATYQVPDALKGSSRIAIRLQSPTSGYYAYNWFYNNSTNGSSPTPPTNPPASNYTGFPKFSIAAVVKDTSVTISGVNFPANDTFKVTMGQYGSYGIGGVSIGTVDSKSGGNLSETFQIPDSLKGSYIIAIRLQSATSGYFAYNWFYNNTAPWK